ENEVGDIFSRSFISIQGRTVSKIYIRSPWAVYGVFSNIQIEKSSVATEYEPFKSNILTVNEEVELRKVGGVQDELNLLTGELTQRVEKLVLDGSGFNFSPQIRENTISFYNNSIKFAKQDCMICDKLPTKPNSTWQLDTIGVDNGMNDFRISVSKSMLGDKPYTAQGFRDFLKENPLTILYIPLTESVKTVDLKCVNQDDESIDKCCTFTDGSIIISSDGLTPTLEYILSTTNYFELNGLKSEANYTLRFDGEATSGTLGGSTINTVNDTLVATSATNNILYLDGEVSNIMLLEGNYTGRDIPYFTGMRSVEAIEVETTPSPDQPLFGKGGRK
ncbi:MAG: hypothetical protein IJ085_02345, partial [Turicibacter sp.]|nr:hypothetical protein [Turicibacter sp.]